MRSSIARHLGALAAPARVPGSITTADGGTRIQPASYTVCHCRAEVASARYVEGGRGNV